jgi:hypothetical protein
MATPDRTENVAGLVDEIRREVNHTLGLCVLSSAARDELVAFITLMETEVAGRSRRLSPRLEAYRLALSEGGRASATNGVERLGDLLPLRSQEVDLRTAAEMTGIDADTLRRAAREGRITGRRIHKRWWLDVASVEAYKPREKAS